MNTLEIVKHFLVKLLSLIFSKSSMCRSTITDMLWHEKGYMETDMPTVPGFRVFMCFTHFLSLLHYLAIITSCRYFHKDPVHLEDFPNSSRQNRQEGFLG